MAEAEAAGEDVSGMLGAVAEDDGEAGAGTGERNYFAGPSHAIAGGGSDDQGGGAAVDGAVDAGDEDAGSSEPVVSPGARRREQARMRLARMGR